jgi:hypothetical protein
MAMLYSIPWVEPLQHGAAGPLDEILMVVAFLGGWGALLYFLLRDRGQGEPEDEAGQGEQPQPGP